MHHFICFMCYFLKRQLLHGLPKSMKINSQYDRAHWWLPWQIPLQWYVNPFHLHMQEVTLYQQWFHLYKVTFIRCPRFHLCKKVTFIRGSGFHLYKVTLYQSSYITFIRTISILLLKENHTHLFWCVKDATYSEWTIKKCQLNKTWGYTSTNKQASKSLSYHHRQPENPSHCQPQ